MSTIQGQEHFAQCIPTPRCAEECSNTSTIEQESTKEEGEGSSQDLPELSCGDAQSSKHGGCYTIPFSTFSRTYFLDTRTWLTK
jgi:hypothetical protein